MVAWYREIESLNKKSTRKESRLITDNDTLRLKEKLGNTVVKVLKDYESK